MLRMNDTLKYYDQMVTLKALYAYDKNKIKKPFLRKFQRICKIVGEDYDFYKVVSNCIDLGIEKGITFDDLEEMFKVLRAYDYDFNLTTLLTMSTLILWFVNTKENLFVDINLLNKLDIDYEDKDSLEERFIEIKRIYKEYYEAYLQISSRQEYKNDFTLAKNIIDNQVDYIELFNLMIGSYSLPRIRRLRSIGQ